MKCPVTDKLSSIFDFVTDKLEPWFVDLSKANQRRVMTCYLSIVHFSLPLLYLAACIYMRRFPQRLHMKEVFAEWKVFKRESYKDLEQWQKENTKLHRALK